MMRFGRFFGRLVVPALLCALYSIPALGQAEIDLSRPAVGATPTRVHVGFYLADLNEVSGGDQTLMADVVVQAEWEDPRLAGRWSSVHSAALDAVWNPSLQLLNPRGVSPYFAQRVEIDPSGRVRWRQRWIGRFSTRMDLRDFPFDHQRFRIQLVSLGYGPSEIELIPDIDNSTFNRATELSISDWAVGPAQIELADFDPGPGAKVQSGVQLSFEGQRHAGYYAIQVILPLVLIVLMGSGALWVDPSVVQARLSVSMTTMLTLISYRFSIGKSVPNLAYLTRFDYFMLASTIMIFLILSVVVLGAYLMSKRKPELVDRIDVWARVSFPVLFGTVFVLSWWG
jgi:hypothetical protein